MAIWGRFWNLLRARCHNSSLDDEFAFHIQMRTEDNIASGMSPAEAGRDALRRFGNRTGVKESTRDAGILIAVDSLAQDTKYALRSLRHSRGISSLVIAALALGIGANTAMFTITHALVLRSLPVRDPAHLFNIGIGNFMSWGSIEADNSFTWALWDGFARQQDVLTDLFVYAEKRYDAVLNGETKPVLSAYVTTPMFRSLGLAPIAGRLFEESTPPGVALISNALWAREFSSDRSVIGRTLIIEGKPFTVTGVLPPRFFGLTAGHAVDVYLPLSAEPYVRGSDSALRSSVHYWLQVFGRLREGVSFEQARNRLIALSSLSMRATLPLELPQRVRPQYLKQTFIVAPAPAGISYIRTNLRYPLIVISIISALLLLLTCFTVANLLLARGTVRQPEMAVRIALGAGRPRIMRQLLLESVILSIAGTVLSLPIARSSAALLIRFYSAPSDPIQLDLSLDWSVFIFALGLAVASTVVFGLAPAFRTSQVTPAESLRSGRATASASILGARRIILAGQIAVSVVLVTGAVLFGSTLRNLMTVNTGFQPDRVLLAEIDMRRSQVAKTARRQFYLALLERIKRLPVAESASISYEAPISGGTWQFDVKALTSAGPKPVHIHFNAVSPDYFRTFGTSLLAGRGFSPRDDPGSAPVAVVNATLARAAFGSMDVIGRRIALGDPEPHTAEIVGVAEDAKYKSLRQPIPPTLYTPFMQYSAPPRYSTVAVRSRANASALGRDIAGILTQEYPSVSYRLTSLNGQIRDSVARERAFALLCSVFAALALGLAAIGIYGVLSHFIAQKQTEIGIRLALGATPSAVRALIYRQSAVWCAAGLCAGCLLAYWGGGYTRKLLYGVSAGNVSVYGAATAIIAVVAVLATIIPALRAARTDSMRVLRCE